MNRNFWNGKRVFITGHTGFKGGWLALWLSDMGAHVEGFALPPPTRHNFYDATGLHHHLARSTIADIRDIDLLKNSIQSAQPEIVFHMAAQSLVRHAYQAPLDTYATNVMGTVNLLETIRQTPGVKAVVNVTTDKCYENKEWLWPYRENEPLGGLDPYSSSKACAELITTAYRHSFLSAEQIYIASARAGNVIGGGDWAADRLLPDFIRALDAQRPLCVRAPQAIRPWQHALEPLAGYLILAEKLYEEGAEFAQAWNFGPDASDTRTVSWIAQTLCELAPGAQWNIDATQHPHEATTLKLDSTKAKTLLNWQPRWCLRTALQRTLEWHQEWKRGKDMAETTLQQIHAYESAKVANHE